MFSQMETTLVIALVVAGVVFVAAMAAEGRAQHLLRVILRLEGGRGKEYLFADVERHGNDLSLVNDLGRLEARSRTSTEFELSRTSTELPVRDADTAAA